MKVSNDPKTRRVPDKSEGAMLSGSTGRSGKAFEIAEGDRAPAPMDDWVAMPTACRTRKVVFAKDVCRAGGKELRCSSRGTSAFRKALAWIKTLLTSASTGLEVELVQSALGATVA